MKTAIRLTGSDPRLPRVVHPAHPTLAVLATLADSACPPLWLPAGQCWRVRAARTSCGIEGTACETMPRAASLADRTAIVLADASEGSDDALWEAVRAADVGRVNEELRDHVRWRADRHGASVLRWLATQAVLPADPRTPRLQGERRTPIGFLTAWRWCARGAPSAVDVIEARIVRHRPGSYPSTRQWVAVAAWPAPSAGISLESPAAAAVRDWARRAIAA